MIRKPIERERSGEMEMVEVEDGEWVKYAEAINTLDEVMEYAECESEE